MHEGYGYGQSEDGGLESDEDWPLCRRTSVASGAVAQGWGQPTSPHVGSRRVSRQSDFPSAGPRID
jgi:hypothetical protein